MITLRRHVTYANVMSTIAVFAALAGGTAFAATKLLTGANIKDGSITSTDVANGVKGIQSVDVRDGSLGAADLSPAARRVLAGQQGPAGPAGAQGADGARGPAGAAGAPGARGLSAWDVIPSGTTIVGGISHDVDSDAGSNDWSVTVQLPARTPVPLTDEDVNFGTSNTAATDDDAACTGSTATPTAPAGKVCLYAGFSSGSSPIAGYALVSGAASTGFAVSFADDGGDGFMAGAWAYTAP